MTKTVTATERLYQTADKGRLVPEGDPEAAFLFCTPGSEIPARDAERYGLTGAKVQPKGEDKERKEKGATKERKE